MGRRVALAMFAGAAGGAVYGAALPFVFPSALAGFTLTAGLAAARWAIIYLLLFGTLAVVGALFAETRRIR